MRRLVVLTLLALAGCGGDSAPSPERDRAPAVPDGGVAGGHDADRAPAVPDGGVAAGHGAEDARARNVRVPERDATPPLALIRVAPGGAAPPVVHRSPVRARRSAPIELARPLLRATAVVRDADGGTGRIRLTVRYVATCGGDRQRRTLHHPPPQIESIRLAPGTAAPTRRTRSARVRLPARCRVTGEAFADATNAHGLESFSDPVRFAYG